MIREKYSEGEIPEKVTGELSFPAEEEPVDPELEGAGAATNILSKDEAVSAGKREVANQERGDKDAQRRLERAKIAEIAKIDEQVLASRELGGPSGRSSRGIAKKEKRSESGLSGRGRVRNFEDGNELPKRESTGDFLKKHGIYIDPSRQPSDKGRTGKKKGWLRKMFIRRGEDKQGPQDQL